MKPTFSKQAEQIERIISSPYNKKGHEDFCSAVKTVVVVVCSPRSGSSLLASIFRRTDQLLNFQGAITPFLGLANLRYPESGDSDALTVEQLPTAIANNLPLYLGQECGTLSESLPDQQSKDQFAVDLAIRLCMQWPMIDFDVENVRQAMLEALESLVSELGWKEGAFEDVELFHAVFLKYLCRVYPQVNPYLYDIDKDLIARFMPDVEPVAVLPSSRFIEMPPLITISPWKPASAEDLANKSVIIKTVANTFRLSFLKALFPQARFRILHLTRRIAASANGMYDGWHFPGFWAARVDRDLQIPGYSDVYPEWGKRWWKFGLAPGWQNMTDRPVVELAAFHWRTCHETILQWLDDHPDIKADSLRIKFEDLLGSPREKQNVYTELTDWLNIELDDDLAFARDNDMPLQLATAKPAPERWRKRIDLLRPVLENPANIALMRRLGYEPDLAVID